MRLSADKKEILFRTTDEVEQNLLRASCGYIARRRAGPDASSTLSSLSTRRLASDAPSSMPATSSPLASVFLQASSNRAIEARATGVPISESLSGAADELEIPGNPAATALTRIW
jgi:hypothetical protein